jgi:hypothetical protein
MGARPLKSSDVEEILKAANLNGLPQVFYSGAQGLNLVVKEDGRFVPNAHAETAKEVLDFLKREHTYGNKVAGKDLEIHFTQKPGYGWELDMVRLVLATLLRAGAIEVTYQGHRYHNHLDPLCRTPLTTITAFRAASFAPHESIELQTLTTAVKHYEELVGAEVDVEEGAIAEALKKIANDEMKLLLPVCAEASAYKLPFRSVLDTYQENLAEILNADSDDCVRILAGEGNTLKATRDQVRRIRQTMAEGHLIMLIQQARLAAEEQWPLLQSTTAGPPLLPQKEAVVALLVSETCYEELPRIRSLAQAITEAYQAHYQVQHRARFEEYSQAIDEIKGHVRWPLVPESARASVLGQLEYCACQEEAELLDGVLECQRCKASLITIDAQRINIQTNKTQTLTRLYEITTPVGEMAPAPIRQVKASAFFSDVLESNEDLDEAIERLREHVRGLLAEGARVIVG